MGSINSETFEITPNTLFSCNSKMQLITNTIRNGNFETISLDVHPYAICQLPFGGFISSNDGSTTVFDEKFNILKKIKRNPHQEGPYSLGSRDYAKGCAISNNKDIYVSDNVCIYLMDSELNIVETFYTELNREDSCSDKFYSPTYLFCQGECLFVCDFTNQRIKIMKNFDFKNQETFQLYIHPYSIAVSSTTIGICGFNMFSQNVICFYDKTTKKLKKKYEEITGRISIIGANFYVISSRPNKILFVYDQEGNLIKEVTIEKFSHLIKDIWDGLMISSEDYLFVASFNEQKVLKFMF